MKFDKHYPGERLKPYIKYFVVSENNVENEYKVFPSTELVIGFQYKGQLDAVQWNAISNLSSAGKDLQRKLGWTNWSTISKLCRITIAFSFVN